MKNQQIDLRENERVEDLMCDGLKIIQNKDLYTFTSDSVVLANFVKIKRSETAVEIGSGSGIISILLSKKTAYKKIFGIEIQKELFEMSQRSLELNGIKNVEFFNDNALNYKKYFSPNSIDVVFSNPPYKRLGSSELNKNKSKAIARHEASLPLKDLISIVKGMLKFGGRFYCVYDADRVCELVFELMKNKIEPKRMFFTSNGKGKHILVVIEAVSGGKHGVEVLPEIVTNDLDGSYIYKIQEKK